MENEIIEDSEYYEEDEDIEETEPEPEPEPKPFKKKRVYELTPEQIEQRKINLAKGRKKMKQKKLIKDEYKQSLIEQEQKAEGIDSRVG